MMHREFFRSSTNWEFEFLTVTSHLPDAEPEVKQFDAYAHQPTDPSVFYEARDDRLVLDLVSLDWEPTRVVEIDFEKASFVVQVVVDDTFW